MKKRIISALLVIAAVFSVCPVCFADGSECFAVSNIEKGSGFEISETVCVNGTVIVSGVHSMGEGQYLTMRVVDNSNNTVYAMGETESVLDGRFYFNFGLRDEAHGKKLALYIDGGEGTTHTKLNFVFECCCGANRAALKQSMEEIEALIVQCEGQNISVEYEKVNLGVIKRFDGFLDGYIEKGLINEYGHNFGVIDRLAQTTKESLCAYLAKTRTAKIAPIYQSSRISQIGQSLLANVSLNGEIMQQPVFFNGYGHWSDAISDYESFPEMGANFTHFEVGPNSILKPGTEGRKYDVDTASVNWVKSVFEKAEKNNVSVMFMTSMHYFPKFIYDSNPGINNNGNGSFPDFMPYNPTHPEVLAALKAFLNAIIPEIKDYRSFHSICLANEPLFISYEYPDYYLSAYRDFLRKKYDDDISALRNEYGFLYWNKTFENITMPERPSNSAYYNDWREFNDSILTAWFTELNGIVKNIDENIPVHTKVSAYISSAGSGSRRVFCGTNYEQWSQIMDLNGCDAWGIYGEKSSKIQGKTMWYDFMTSLKNAPVINSEDHILKDSAELVYNENELRFNMADMWQGAIHGRAGSVYWLWDKSSRATEGTYYYNANLSRRADHVAAIGKINLDLNRLANEITAIQKKDARCAILYSNYTQVTKSEKHLAGMYEAYRFLQNNGEKVFIVNDTYPEKLNENKNIELLIVPVCDYMPQKVWSEIEKFIDDGKTVIFAESNSSYYNENGKSLDSTLKNKVLNNSVRVSFGGWSSINGTFSQPDSVWSAIGNAIAQFDHDVKVTSGNGETEWTAAEYGNGYVVNLCNYGNAETEIEIDCSDLAFSGKMFDLTENEEISATFMLQPYETKLVRLDNIKEGLSFWSKDGSEAEKVKIVSKANVTLTANSPFMHIIAVYSKDMRLQKLGKTFSKADQSGKVLSEADVEILKAEADNYIIKTFLLDSAGSLKPYVQEVTLNEN